MTAKEVALAFIDAINRHDVEEILSLMTDDHIFMDTYGNCETKSEMESGWPGYFAWFPDYRIEVADLMEAGDKIGVFGYAAGTYSKAADNAGYWRLPAAWKVEVRGGKVKLWQVFADSKIPYEIMGKADG